MGILLVLRSVKVARQVYTLLSLKSKDESIHEFAAAHGGAYLGHDGALELW
jgi:hypothetical protein